MEKNKKIEILQEMIKIKSVNGNEEEVAIYIKEILEKYNIDSTLVNYSPGRSSLIAEIGANKRKVLGFSGHMDVVETGDENLWLYPPFDAHIEKDKLYGRGSTDMKSGLSAMVIAMIELKEEKLPVEGTIRLIATVGEEVGELGATQLTKLGYIDELDALIIGEPSNYNLIYAHMGSIDYTVISQGREAHSSMPKLGINAINYLTNFIINVNNKMHEVAKMYKDDVLGRTIHNVTVISGGNQVNSIPGVAILKGNIRTVPKYDNKKIVTLLNSIVEEMNQEKNCQLKLVIDYNKKPVKGNKNSVLIETIQEQFEQPLPVIGIAGTTDAAEFLNSNENLYFVIFGPGVTDLPHQLNEYVSIKNYLDMIEKYKAIAKEYLAK